MVATGGEAPRRAGTIWTFDLEGPAPVVAPLLETSFRRAGQKAVLELTSSPAGNGSLNANTLHEMRRRLKAGRHCYAAWVEGMPAAYGWVSFNEEFVGELDLRLRLLPGEAYIWDCFTLPDFRRRRLYSSLLVHIAGELRAQKYRRVWIGADLDNTASQRGIARAGFLHVADLVEERSHAMRMIWLQAESGVSESLVAEAQRAFLGSRYRAWREVQPLAAPA